MIKQWHENIKKTGSKIVSDFEDFVGGLQRYTTSVKIINIIGKIQSGKTEVMQYVAGALNRSTSGSPHRLFYSITYPNIELFDQFKNDMKSFPNVITIKLTTMLRNGDMEAYKRLKQRIEQSISFGNVLFLGIDESEFRVGANSILDKLLKQIFNDYPHLRVYIMFVGATPSSLRSLENDTHIPIQNFHLLQHLKYLYFLHLHILKLHLKEFLMNL